MQSRRGFLESMLVAAAAPVIIKTSSLMHIQPLVPPPIIDRVTLGPLNIEMLEWTFTTTPTQAYMIARRDFDLERYGQWLNGDLPGVHHVELQVGLKPYHET